MKRGRKPRVSPPVHGEPSALPPIYVHQTLVALLKELPPSNTHWAPEKKTAWVVAFSAALNWVYPLPIDYSKQFEDAKK